MINFDYCYKATCNIPRTYREAIDSSDAHCWVEAMHEELESLKENNVFELTNLPEGKKTVGSKWVYTTKENPDGSKRYKARFVARGFSQKKGIDYGETFSPTASITSIYILMQMVVQYDLIVHQMDVKTAYLHAPIVYEIFVEHPEGFKTNKLVYRLNKSLYGLKQSGRNWNKMLHECLIRNDFIQNPADHCVYMKQNERLLIVSWVDELIIAADKVITLSNVKKMLMSEFKMIDPGKLNHFIGIDFHTTHESLYLIQLLNGMGPQQRYEPAKILGDNQGAIALSKDPVNRQRCKHIDIKYHFIRDALHKKKIEIIYCPTTNMIADIMTKPMTKLKLERFKRLLFGL